MNENEKPMARELPTANPRERTIEIDVATGQKIFLAASKHAWTLMARVEKYLGARGFQNMLHAAQVQEDTITEEEVRKFIHSRTGLLFKSLDFTGEEQPPKEPPS